MIEIPKDQWSKINRGKPDNDILQVFKSERFLVQVRQHNNIVRLAINKVKWSNIDGKIIWQDGITWDELQEIKNQCGFKDSWLCEYYPPQTKLVNIANVRHLWVMDKEPDNHFGK